MPEQGRLVLLLAVLTQVTSKEWLPFTFKCCGVNEQLDSFTRCVNASWEHVYPYPILAERGLHMTNDRSWMTHWHPPGPVRDRLVQNSGLVVHSLLSSSRPSSYKMTQLSYDLKEYHLVSAVHRSYLLEDGNDKADWARSLVIHNYNLVRFRPQNQPRLAVFCVDAIQGNLAPYGVVFRTGARDGDVFSKCCRLGQLLVSTRSGSLQCAADSRAWTTIWNSSLSPQFDAETPFRAISDIVENVRDLRNKHFHTTAIPSGNHNYAQYIQQRFVTFLSATWIHPCVDLAQDESGDVAEIFGYFEVTRLTRATYFISRNLSYVAVLVLCAALVAIACKERMRSSAHGWALACHVVCLLFFNIGQIVYTETMSDKMDKRGPPEPIDEETARVCLAFAIPMYFLLSSANAWMTAVCANMFLGFKLVRKNQGAGASRAAAGERRRFLKLSAFAWSVAAALTAVSVTTFILVTKKEDIEETRFWYRPTFTETRTCFLDVTIWDADENYKYRSQKWGTILYYYVPTLALAVANGVFLCRTGLKVRYLRRGNSLLKRDEREGGGKKGRGGQQDKDTSEPKSVTVYIKLLLAGSVLECLAEFLAWALSSYHPLQSQPSQQDNERDWDVMAHMQTFHFKDYVYPPRITGYWADLFRALVVLWLAVPEPPDLRAVWRRMRGEGGDSPAQGAATRPAPRPAARPAPRRGQQESAL